MWLLVLGYGGGCDCRWCVPGAAMEAGWRLHRCEWLSRMCCVPAWRCILGGRLRSRAGLWGVPWVRAYGCGYFGCPQLVMGGSTGWYCPWQAWCSSNGVCGGALQPIGLAAHACALPGRGGWGGCCVPACCGVCGMGCCVWYCNWYAGGG